MIILLERKGTGKLISEINDLRWAFCTLSAISDDYREYSLLTSDGLDT